MAIPTFQELIEQNAILNQRLTALEDNFLRLNNSFNSLIENAPIGIIVVENGKIFDLNSAFVKLLQYQNSDELKGKNIIEIIHPDFRDIAKQRLRELQTASVEKVIPLEEKMICKNGDFVDVLIAGQKSYYQNKPVILGYIFDITEQKKAESNDKIFKILFDNAPDGIVIIDKEGFITDCNKEFYKQLKLDKSQIIGTQTSNYILEKSIFKEVIEELSEKKVTDRIVTQTASDNSTLPVWRKITGLYDKQNKLYGAVAISRDISEIEQAKALLKRSIEEIQLQNEEITASNEELRALNEEFSATNDALRDSYAQNEKIIAELRKSEKKFRLTAENSEEYLFMFSIDERAEITYVSPSIAKMGYQTQHLLKTSLYDLLNQDDQIRIGEIIEQGKLLNINSIDEQGVKSEKLTINVLDSQNKIHFWEISLSIFSNFGLMISLDNTKRIENENIKKIQEQTIIESRDKLLELNKKLAKSEESYRNIYNSTSDAIFIHNSKTGSVVDANSAASEMFGFTYNELINIAPNKICAGKSPYSDVESSEYIKKAKTEGVQHFIWRSKKKDGTIFWTDITLKYAEISDENRIISVVRDVDKNIESQKALAESEEKFRELTETSPTAIFIYRENRFVHVNQSTVNMTGYTKEELMGMNFWDVVHPDMREMVKNMGYQRQQGEDVPTRYEMKLLTKNGEERWIDFNGSRVNYRGQPAAIGNVIDITKTKEIVRQLIAAKEKAEEADHLKSAFLANMSHEIRTPLNGILGFSQLLNDDIDDERKNRYIEIINKSGEQLLTIITDILDISKIEVGQLTLVLEKYSVNSIIDDIYLMFKFQSQHRNLEFFLEKSLQDSDSLIYTDDVRLKQILSNLINNALKFTKSGYIKYGYQKKEGFLEFFVEDTGIGVPKEKQELIFDRFRQSNETTTRDFGGTGLGLSICKGIVELFGGKIWVESDGKTGSTFRFTIPYKRDN